MSNSRFLRLIAACGIASSFVLSAHAQTRSTLDARPAATESEIEQGLRRFLGQTRFVTAQRQYRMRAAAGLEAAPAAMADAKGVGGGGERRDVVDSDVYNAGPAGSKILLLLNGYRGLMVLDFSKGPDNPILVGRSPATGNHPSNMYVDWKSKRAIVIENWQRENYGAGARILVYDLTDLTNPKVVQSQEVGGSVSDSRLVGDVLYLVGAQRPQYYYNDNKMESYIKSFRVGGKGIEAVAAQTLNNQIDYRENMGIQETRTADGKYNYYVTAVTKKAGQWWWRGRSEVEVFDISSPKGEIEPVLVANVTGDINKRSWVNIHNDTLTVTSNYRLNERDWQSPRRVAVETFRLPSGTKNPEVISEDELKFRELAIARYLGRDATAEAKEKALSGSDLKLRGVFVHEEHKDPNDRNVKRSVLRKVVSDFKTLEFGDTRGQSAEVQDVRYVTDDNGSVRAHIFWVPADMKDPLDIVDITDVNARPVHQSQFEFSGWIERSIPINFKGRRFIVALGYIVPAVDNPNNQRFAQAKVFEIKRKRGAQELTAEEVDTLTLPKVQWSNMGGHDKLLGMQYDADTGRGSLLFQGTSWNRTTGSGTGGQVVDFDLSQAANEDAKLLSEGAFIQGEEGWLRRVFMHPNLQAMMTFSERELGVFKPKQGEKVIEAATRMELARNIVAYHDLPQLKIGVQVVQKGDYYARNKRATEIRIVPSNNADAEQPAVLASHQVLGSYKDHWIDTTTGEIVVLTSDEDYSYGERETTRTSKFRVERLKYDGARVIAQDVEHESKRVDRHDDRILRREREEEPSITTNVSGLVKVAANRWAFTDSFNNIWQIEASADGLKKIPVKLTGAVKDTRLTLTVIDGQLFAMGHKPVGKADEESNFEYYESSVGPIMMTDESNWTILGKAMVNIPGTAESFVIRNGEVVGVLSKENRVVDVNSGLTEPVLHLTWLSDNGQTAELRSMMNSDESTQLVRTSGNQWMFVEKSQGSEDMIMPMRMGMMLPDPYGSRAQGLRLGILDVDMNNPTLHRTVRQLDGALQGYGGQILKVSPGAQPHLRLVVVSSGSSVQVLEVDLNTKAVKALTIKPVNTFVAPVAEVNPNERHPRSQEVAGPSTVWSIPGYTWMGYRYGMGSSTANNTVTVTPQRLLIASGDYGVCEAELSSPADVKPKQ